MSRRRRRTRNRRRKGSPNYWLILVQVVVLAGVLVFIILFRDYLAMTTSNVVNSFSTGGDLDVAEKQADEADQPAAADRPDPEAGNAPSLEMPNRPATNEDADDE
jgi:hypothetical protein